MKEICTNVLLKKEGLHQVDIFYQWYDLICDIIDTKLYKPPIIKDPKKAPKFVCIVNFINKGMDNIGLAKIINKPEIFDKLPDKFKRNEDEKICVTYRLAKPIRNKIFNYKETVKLFLYKTLQV